MPDSKPHLPLQGQRVVLGVGGGIAAYKAAELCRLLVKSGATVQVAMTRSAQEFVGPLTFQALSSQRVFTEVLELGQDADIGHIEIADNADLFVLAPATANLIARLAEGRADDAVTTAVLATQAPVLVCPAMNVNMWEHPLTQANIERLEKVARYTVLAPAHGELACGWVGPGRLPEPAHILDAVIRTIAPRDFSGKRLVVSAGPTREPIDPVRYISNRSSGRMGYAIARAAERRGADVLLVSGPVALRPPRGVKVVPVVTARDMHREMVDAFSSADAVVMAAAVADARPKTQREQKWKKQPGGVPPLELTENVDILRALARARGENQAPVLMGFAAETEALLQHAQAKLQAKGCDAIVANDVSAADAGFDVDHNRATLVTRDGTEEWERMTKDAMAHRILDWLQPRLAGS